MVSGEWGRDKGKGLLNRLMLKEQEDKEERISSSPSPEGEGLG
jgi:hypothetical protein